MELKEGLVLIDTRDGKIIRLDHFNHFDSRWYCRILRRGDGSVGTINEIGDMVRRTKRGLHYYYCLDETYNVKQIIKHYES